MIQKSGSKIPSEWIERIEQEGDKNTKNYELLDRFIILHYANKTVSAISRATGFGYGVIRRRIEQLKKGGKLNE